MITRKANGLHQAREWTETKLKPRIGSGGVRDTAACRIPHRSNRETDIRSPGARLAKGHNAHPSAREKRNERSDGKQRVTRRKVFLRQMMRKNGMPARSKERKKQRKQTQSAYQEHNASQDEAKAGDPHDRS